MGVGGGEGVNVRVRVCVCACVLCRLFQMVVLDAENMDYPSQKCHRQICYSRRVTQGTTKDIPTETMRFMPDRKKVEQVNAFFSAVNKNPHNHEPVKHIKGCRLGRGKSRMGQAEDSILQVSQLTQFKQTQEWGRYPDGFRHLWETLLLKNLGSHCREKIAGKMDSEFKLLI